ncbi:hypothetical protein C7444_12513 [Sphaerotilus hippei]|uniref:Permease n=1 Tax=Sphaerotilus hippei TaxID=744406 RepID=A0A318GYW7_9BURK|nr:AEC family transporter [Sphaerotilus hippei]PXW92339.1 hypothetical protein C7444_12513 [Sphaerotilus hippei]
MFTILTLTIPVYLLIGAGFLSVRGGLFVASDMRVLGKFVVNFCLPGLLFNALASRRLDEVFNARYLGAYALGSLLVLGLGLWIAHRVRRLPMDVATLHGLGMSASNSGFFGYAIAAPLVGAPAAVGLALTMMVENLLMLPLVLALADAGASGRRGSQSFVPAFRIALRNLGRNPMILAILAGLLFALLEIELPAPVARTVQLVATAASPVALFVIGGTLAGFGVRGMLRDVSVVSTGKLLLHPLAVGTLLWAFGPIDPALRETGILLASVPMLSIYPVIAQRYEQEGFCAAALLVTTVASFFTINAVLWLLRHVPQLTG